MEDFNVKPKSYETYQQKPISRIRGDGVADIYCPACSAHICILQESIHIRMQCSVCENVFIPISTIHVRQSEASQTNPLKPSHTMRKAVLTIFILIGGAALYLNKDALTALLPRDASAGELVTSTHRGVPSSDDRESAASAPGALGGTLGSRASSREGSDKSSLPDSKSSLSEPPKPRPANQAMTSPTSGQSRLAVNLAQKKSLDALSAAAFRAFLLSHDEHFRKAVAFRYCEIILALDTRTLQAQPSTRSGLGSLPRNISDVVTLALETAGRTGQVKRFQNAYRNMLSATVAISDHAMAEIDADRVRTQSEVAEMSKRIVKLDAVTGQKDADLESVRALTSLAREQLKLLQEKDEQLDRSLSELLLFRTKVEDIAKSYTRDESLLPQTFEECKVCADQLLRIVRGIPAAQPR